jgi:hypothetical protein
MHDGFCIVDVKSAMTQVQFGNDAVKEIGNMANLSNRRACRLIAKEPMLVKVKAGPVWALCAVAEGDSGIPSITGNLNNRKGGFKSHGRRNEKNFYQ